MSTTQNTSILVWHRIVLIQAFSADGALVHAGLAGSLRINQPFSRSKESQILVGKTYTCLLRAEEQHRKDQLEIATLQKQVRDVGDNVRDAVTGIKAILLGFGFTPETAAAATEEQIAISQKENTLVKTAIETSDASSKSERQKIAVQYFPKDVDPVVIRNTLSSLGFTFREGTALQREATNAIWFGQDVPLSDVKLVALTLVRAGVDLKTIRPFRKSHPVPDRNFLIQVGTDAEFSGKTSISVTEIANATAFTRPD